MTIKMFHRAMVVSLILLVFLGSVVLTGCSRHPSPEELNTLEMTKQAALAAEKEAEAKTLLDAGLVHPGYDAVIKCSHVFNVLEARGAISVTERTGYIARVRNLSRQAARAYVDSREELGFPLLKEKEAE